MSWYKLRRLFGKLAHRLINVILAPVNYKYLNAEYDYDVKVFSYEQDISYLTCRALVPRTGVGQGWYIRYRVDKMSKIAVGENGPITYKVVSPAMSWE